MLNDKIVAALPVPTQGPRITYDARSAADDQGLEKARGKTVPGFGARVTPAGARSFVLNYRVAGRERRITIGSFPAWTTGAARKEAARLRTRIDQGEDPLAERHAARTAATMRELAERYIAEHATKKRSRRDDEAMLRQWIVPALGNVKVADLRHADIQRLHRKVTEAGRATRANRIVAVISKMMALAVKWEMRTDNPAKGIERNAEQPRERYLTDDEIARLNEALSVYPNRNSAHAIKLLLGTGCRRNEALSARWSEFDLDAGVWVKPPSNTKQARAHRVPLSADIIAMLREMRDAAERDVEVHNETRRLGQPKREASEFVFPGRGTSGPQQELKKAWAKICRIAGIEGVRIHDVRHSFASVLASQGVSLQVIGAILGHSQAQTTLRYAHLFDAPLRDAAERVSKAVTDARRAAPKVVKLGKNTVGEK